MDCKTLASKSAIDIGAAAVGGGCFEGAGTLEWSPLIHESVKGHAFIPLSTA